MKLSIKVFRGIIVGSSILFILLLAYPIIIEYTISTITGVTIDNKATHIGIIRSADGPTAVIQGYTDTGIPITRYCLLGMCAIVVLFSVIKIRKFSKTVK